MGNFKKVVPGRVDKEVQKRKKLSDLEELIFKPHGNNGKDVELMTEEEFNRYINLNIEELYKTKMNSKTIMLASATKECLNKEKEKILRVIRKKEESLDER